MVVFFSHPLSLSPSLPLSYFPSLPFLSPLLPDPSLVSPLISSLYSTYLTSQSLRPISVQVNGIDLRKATHDEAINVLRQTPQRVRLMLYRDEAPYREEDVYDTLTIELQKKPGKGLGLSIVGKRYD